MNLKFPSVVTLSDDTLLGVALNHDALLKLVHSVFHNDTLTMVSDDWTISSGRGHSSFLPYPNVSNIDSITVYLEQVDIYE